MVLDMESHTHNPISWELRQVNCCEYKASLVYIGSSNQPGLQSETPIQRKKPKKEKKKRKKMKKLNK